MKDNKILVLYKKYEEIISYLFWGGLAFVLSMLLYWVFESLMGFNSVAANTIDWVICVIFTYFTNKIFVFKSKVSGVKEKLKEFIEFVAARLLTLIIEDIIVFIGVDLLKFDSNYTVFTILGFVVTGSIIVKLIGQFVVIVSNYILSKLWIFKGNNNE